MSKYEQVTPGVVSVAARQTGSGLLRHERDRLGHVSLDAVLVPATAQRRIEFRR